MQRSRAEALNPRVVKEYFDLLNKTLVDNNLMNSPRQIYNCDETFMPLDSTREKAVITKGAKNVYCQELGSSEHITVLCCASAAGIPHRLFTKSHFLEEPTTLMVRMMHFMLGVSRVG